MAIYNLAGCGVNPKTYLFKWSFIAFFKNPYKIKAVLYFCLFLSSCCKGKMGTSSFIYF